jgi:hypothetical protein
VLQRHGTFAFGSKLDVLHVRVHGMIDSSDSALNELERDDTNARKSTVAFSDKET